MDPRTRHCSVLGWRSEIDGPLIGWTRNIVSAGGGCAGCGLSRKRQVA